MTQLTINGKKVEAPGGTILDAARASGVRIPTLCHHPALAPQGACRLCLVEVKGMRVLQPACTCPSGARPASSAWNCFFPITPMTV